MSDATFVQYLKSEEILFKHAKGMRDIFGKEFHVFHELFLLIGNTAKFTSDHLIDTISSHSLVIIPKQAFHQFDCIGEEKYYHRYVLQFDHIEGLEQIIASVFDRVKLIHNISPSTLLLFERLDSLVSENYNKQDKELLLKAVCTQLLLDLKYNYSETAITQHVTDSTVERIVDHINTYFLTDISLRSIAGSLHFSVTYISHKFKEVMHIPIYQYILQKKLTHAHQLICSGTPATDAAYQCGFSEYSSFYKMYKKYFGVSPSKTNAKER